MATPDGVSSEVVVVDAGGQERTVGLTISALNVAFSTMGSLLVNGSDQSGITQLWRVLIGDGRLMRVTNDLTEYNWLSTTSDASVLVTTKAELRNSIWIGESDGRNGRDVVPPTLDHATGGTLTWAADRLVYATAPTGNIQIMSVVPGQTPQELMAGGFYPAASPDGHTLVYMRTVDGMLAKSDGDGRNDVSLGQRGQWSVLTPDGHDVVFVSLRGGIQSL